MSDNLPIDDDSAVYVGVKGTRMPNLCGLLYGHADELERRAEELARRCSLMREALAQIVAFGHADSSEGSTHVYECNCYEEDQGDIALKALKKSGEMGD